MSDDSQGQGMVQSPQSVGTTLEDNLKRKIIFCFFFSLFKDGCHTKSIVESHERSVLRQRELRRDESEASGDEKRKSDDHLSKL
jgi:hypothetical protein